MDNLAFKNRRRQWLFVFLAGLFITSAVTAELISNKLIEIPLRFQVGDFAFGPFVTIVGVLPWPVVFIITDILNEFYGRSAVKRLSWITAALIAYCFIIVGIALQVPAKEIPGSTLATDVEFVRVFGQAQMVIVGSICAFLVSQLLDAYVFERLKHRTGNKWIWLRSTGSTVISQMIDSVVVLYIGFVLPGAISFNDFLSIALTNYFLKLLIALGLTPMIYIGHWAVRKYLGNDQVEE